MLTGVRRGLAVAALLLFSAPGCGGTGAPATPAAVVVRPLAHRPERAARTSPPTAWVELAADPPTRERGLAGRHALRPDCGMLFSYPDEAPRSFWMKDCLIPLDAAFLDRDGRIVTLVRMEPPVPGTSVEDLPRYPSRRPAAHVLEMRAGWFAAAGVAEGQRVDLSAALAGVRPR